jgi:predicted RNA binding protein YcfA (HicA-like mRNA interferase family)
MGKHQKTLKKILDGRSDTNIKFSDLTSLLTYLGFDMRIKGSHHIFRRDGIKVLINLQQDGNKAKPYQVKQVRSVILEYNLSEEFENDE